MQSLEESYEINNYIESIQIFKIDLGIVNV